MVLEKFQRNGLLLILVTGSSLPACLENFYIVKLVIHFKFSVTLICMLI